MKSIYFRGTSGRDADQRSELKAADGVSGRGIADPSNRSEMITPTLILISE